MFKLGVLNEKRCKMWINIFGSTFSKGGFINLALPFLKVEICAHSPALHRPY